MQDTIVVLSRNNALAGLVARTLRSQQVYCRLMPWDTSASQLLTLSPKGVIWAAEHGLQEGLGFLPDLEILDTQIPVLALGQAVAALCAHFGGSPTESLPDNQTVTLDLSDIPLFEGIERGERMLHDLQCLTLPESLSSIATATQRCIGFRHGTLPLYAVEYPIEHNDLDSGQLLFNFATKVCGAAAVWDEDTVIQRAVAAIRAVAGENGVLCAVSGGVDSAVCAKLAHLAVGDKLNCIFVETGLLRKDEGLQVRQVFADSVGLPIHNIEAQDAFLSAMDGLLSPEDKEQATSAELEKILSQQLSQAGDLCTLVMGTNFNDTLFGRAPQLSQRGTLIGATPFRMVEPIRDLFKSEVRRLAHVLGLPASIAERQSFPASGLAARIVGPVTPQRLDILRAADSLFLEELSAGGHEKRLWQSYAMLMEAPNRPGKYIISLQALQAAQGRAYAARLPYDVLERVTTRIRTEVPCVTRVAYDLSPSNQYQELE